jgi:hypothetical protein
MARCCSNEPQALARLVHLLLPFNAEGFRAELEAMIAAGVKVYRTDAYKPIMPPRALKGIKQPEFHTEYVLKPAWHDREKFRPAAGETLTAYSIRLQAIAGVGDFLAAQVIADLKHVAPLQGAADWWTFAAPGPGSKRGLNRALGRNPEASWDKLQWLRELRQLHADAALYLESASMPPLCMQNMQSVCCNSTSLSASVTARARSSGTAGRKRRQSQSPSPRPSLRRARRSRPSYLRPTRLLR